MIAILSSTMKKESEVPDSMKKGVIKAAVLIVVFCAAVVIFGAIANQKNVDLTTEIEEPALPVIYLYDQEQKVNQLFGYTTEMDARYMRDDITPLNENLILPIEVETYSAKISEISYEVRSMDTERLVEDTDVAEYKQEGSVITADLSIQNLLDDNQEYLLIITLTSDDRKVNYYSRIVRNTDSYVKENVDFALDFHDQTLNYDESSSTLATYLEPDSTADNSSLNQVSINSSLSQVTWGGFNGEQLGETNVSIKEINASYNVILLDYCMTATEESGEMTYYNVEEYYRVRYTDDRTYLLNFERNMSQVFRGENETFQENGIQLGIRDTAVEYEYNESGSIVSFVQEGDLWSYSQNEDKLTRVFSFRGLEGMDERENRNEHDIHIIQVNEVGSIDFVVLGYMNRGNHEGEVGTCIYHYDSVTNTIEEELFIPSDQSYQVMKESFGELMYENDDNIFYLMQEGDIYKIDLDTKKEELLMEGLSEGSYCISDSNQYVAWTDGTEEAQYSKIVVYNLQTQESYELKAEAGTYVKPLGFMDTDFIYGIANQQDVSTDNAGNQIFPMYSLKIIDTVGSRHEELKNYQKDGYYVAGITISGNSIALNRVQYNGTAYVQADPDTIKNNVEGEEEISQQVTTSSDEVRQTLVQLQMKDEITDKSPKFLTTNEVVAADDVNLSMERKNEQAKYYTYAKGKLMLATTSLEEAIASANNTMGVVVDDSQAYVWKRAKKTIQTALTVAISTEETSGQSVAQALSSLLGMEELSMGTSSLLAEGQTPFDILNDTMKESQVLDLTGCTVEEVLYYVNLGNPVFAMTGADTAVLIVGYDSANVTLFDGVTGETDRLPLADADLVFSSAGNSFIAYLNK